MRILISTYGSRGDVQPMVALALALQAKGAEVRLSAPADREFAALLERAGLPLVPAFSPVREWIAWGRQPGGGIPQFAAKMVPAQYEALAGPAEGCDAIVATGLFPSVAAAQMLAEQRGIRFAWTAFCPLSLASPDHPPMPYPGWPHPAEMADNLALWERNRAAMNAMFGEAVNAQRTAIGLPDVENVRDHVFGNRPLLASDPMLSPWQPNAMCDAVQTGAWILPDSRPLPNALEDFLQANLPPVYVGFGSMAMQAAPDTARAAIEAIRARGHHILLATGRAGLAAIDSAPDCFVTGEVNQQALFPRVAAIVHHGGAGTTTAATLAGTPQLIVPQVADQPYWASRAAALGIGAAHDGPVPSLESLAAALDIVLAPGTKERASAIAPGIRTDGAETAAEMLAAPR